MPPKPKKSTDDSADPLSRSIGEQLLDALRNADIMEGFCKTIAPSIQLIVQEIVTTTIKDLLAENRSLQTKVKQVTEDNMALKARLSTVEDRLEEMDRERKATNIIIRGLPEQSFSEISSADGEASGNTRHTSVATSVISMIETELEVKLQPHDIATAFRMRMGKSDKTRPILVKFSSTHLQGSVMAAKKKLRASNKNIYINEHLTQRTGELFALARNQVKQKKIFSAWTFKGQLFIKLSSDISSKPIIIKSKDDLQC